MRSFLKLKNLLSNKSTEVLFAGVQVVNEGEKGEYYIDSRTQKNEDGLYVVKPIAWLGGYWYICPDCGQLHRTEMVGLGKIQPGCCLDIDCERHQYLNGEHFLVKRQPIIFDDELGDEADE
ncbi:hypothetical protein L9W92_18300 [Pelotomaculum terephthalicicum JT]|uniref:hypothetical protein n=1 Tax=Pelotomaculum terephthalicicum TaxID=206393 RepID=UPI001F048989|nr:hypothetical protein [Pelotomaculum terephthalicicum]MCG9969950.1 hypothetical protein [Pelotomaculum terephthalicicum JT]